MWSPFTLLQGKTFLNILVQISHGGILRMRFCYMAVPSGYLGHVIVIHFHNDSSVLLYDHVSNTGIDFFC